MSKKFIPLLLTLCVLLAVPGCGARQMPPETYAVGEDSLPSLSSAVSLGENFQYSGVENDDGTVSSRYEALDSGPQAVQDYVQALTEEYECVLVDEEGSRLTLSQPMEEQGSLVAETESTEGDGLFKLTIQWDASSCTVTPSFAEGEQLPEQPVLLSLDEAVALLQTATPASLGLTGSSMSDYDIYPEDGLTFLDGEACLCLNVYDKSTHQYQASYLMAGAEYQIYRLNRDTGEVSPLSF